MKYEFNYVTIETNETSLTIKLNKDGRKYLKEIQDDLDGELDLAFNDNLVFYDLLEDALCNGWQLVNGDQIDGWLTQCDVLGEDIYYDDNGDVVLEGDIYTNINWYQISSNVDMLLKNSCVYEVVR